MLILDLREIGNRLYRIRRNKGLTQLEVAERAELSDRTYADIERGSVNMRTETLLKICGALHITPNEVLVQEELHPVTEKEFISVMKQCSELEKQTALKLLNVYMESLNKE